MRPYILKNKYNFIYCLLWAAVAAVHFFLLSSLYRLPWVPALLDSLVFNILFAVIGLGIRYAAPFLDLKQRLWYELLTQHFTGIVLSILIWITLSNYLLQLFFPNDNIYLSFLNTTRSFRIVIGVFYYTLLNSLFYLMDIYNELQQKLQREAQLSAQLKEAELTMLRSQIRPHFLFNSLNSISALTMSNPARAQEMIIKLSEFMRYSLNFPGEAMSSLEKELSHVTLFLDIEKVRFGDKLFIIYNINPDCFKHPVPAMILQPIIENAVKHGIYESITDTGITINAHHVPPPYGAPHEAQPELSINITNDFDPEASPRKGTGTGLRNVEKRLETVYNRHNLMKTRILNNTYTVELIIPNS